MENLRLILQQLNGSIKSAVEFRHKSWWNDSVYRAFEKAGLIFCSISGPRFPEDLIRTASDIYIRFHGKDRWYRYKYSKAELAIWADKIYASGAEHAWIYFNNDREGHAISNARALISLLRHNSKTEISGRQQKRTFK